MKIKKIRLATVFTGIGAVEQALLKCKIPYSIVFACDNGERELSSSYEEILEHIKAQYYMENSICLLCSEASHDKCHRSLVAEKFKKVFNDIVIINL